MNSELTGSYLLNNFTNQQRWVPVVIAQGVERAESDGLCFSYHLLIRTASVSDRLY